MMRFILSLFVGVVGLLAAPAPLFDGKTLTGWEGDPKVWRVENGEIVGGSMAGNPRNEFLTTKRTFYNFRLTLEYKLIGTEGFVNAGVQFRSLRATNPANEMIGYQADIGYGHTGSLYDESRRKKFLARAGSGVGAYGVKADTEIAELEKRGEWNKYEVRAEGPRITIFLNGKATLDYTETDPSIDDAYGLIGLQIHGNNKAEIHYRNIVLDPLNDLPVTTKEAVMNRFGEAKSAWVPPSPFKDGKFGLSQDEVVVFIGQENLVREAKSGEIESRLAAAFAAKNPVFRSMAWEADTVHEQWRDLNFGPWKGQLESAGATTLILQFGQAEALEGQAGLAKFKADYHKLLDDLSRHTPRIVLLSPAGFMKSQRPPDLTTAARRKDLADYAAAVAEIAKLRGLPFVNLTEVTRSETSTDGLHLSDKGLAAVGQETAISLGLPDKLELSVKLRAAIVEKNRLWADCWRPANWSFVYGDRISQNYGKGFGPVPSLKENFEAYKPLVSSWDKHIQALARGEASVAPAPQSAPAVSTEKVMSATEEQATFKVADGFEVNLFADETLGIAKPTQMSWDAKGRLYVCCSPTYPQAVPGVKPRDYILRLEDTDGDGKADKRTPLYGPFDHTRDTHGNQASFRRGFDGWLYATHGFNNDSHVTARDGSHVDLNSGNTYRIRLDGSRIEHHTHGQVNPFGLAWDARGNLYSSDCHSAPLYQLLTGGWYPSFGKPHDGLGFAPVMLEHAHGSTAIDGAVYYNDNLWPAEYRDTLFIGNVMTSRLNRDTITFSAFEFVNTTVSPPARYSVRAGTLRRVGRVYSGSLDYVDGRTGTAFVDYASHYFTITDLNDADSDGIPDLTDDLPTPPALASFSGTARTLEPGARLELTASAQDPVVFVWK